MKDSTFLLYDKPACAWTQALPIGNGTLGGMIYGKVKEETVSLNHDELWTGHPKDTVPDGALESRKSVHDSLNFSINRVSIRIKVFKYFITMSSKMPNC